MGKSELPSGNSFDWLNGDNIEEQFEILDINMKIQGTEYQASLKKALEIDRSNLKKEFMEHSATYGWWAALYRSAQSRLEFFEDELESYHAELDRQIRESDAIQTSTETEIKQLIRNDKDYKRKQQKVLKARKECKMLKSAVRALEHKKDMLRALNALERQEMQSGMKPPAKDKDAPPPAKASSSED